ncbi:hypothetical protein CSB11_02405 [Candidatus Campbellbacteria bacterium]|nr:MAG: hypothetical protein CSB11_02405 [Candidatus Campbellbacteria bacterium]
MFKKEKSQRQKRVSELIRQIASDFINTETNKTSLITVTHVDVAPNLSQAVLFVTVFPESAEESALNFLKRKRSEIKHAVKKNTKMKRIPFFDFEIDQGEKNHQKIEEISIKSRSKK